MKDHIATLLRTAAKRLQNQQVLPTDLDTRGIKVELSRDKKHGDFAANNALVWAKAAQCPPLKLAQQLCAALPHSELIQSAHIAGPGFINFVCVIGADKHTIQSILTQADKYGHSEEYSDQRVLLESVSSNPTGPLHVGHGRLAAYGDSLANLLATQGYRVQREYYINDDGRQIDILTLSIWICYLKHIFPDVPSLPHAAYHGEYIRVYASMLYEQEAAQYGIDNIDDLYAGIPSDNEGEAADRHLDALIERAQQLLGVDNYTALSQWAVTKILHAIKDDLAVFGVRIDNWFSEKKITHSQEVRRILAKLSERDAIATRAGAQWFVATQYGDEKDRVLIRHNNKPTYFANDTAYHYNKLQRGFDSLINVWGADHHGYVARMRAALRALGFDAQRLKVQLVQLVALYRHGKKIAMSTRKGEFITLRQLIEEVGVDAARFFFVMRRIDQSTEFDLSLAIAQSKDNPVYYIQYAHARICSLYRQLEERSLVWDQQAGLNALAQLEQEEELALSRWLSEYPATLKNAAQQCEPAILVNYLKQLAGLFHSYYNAHSIIVNDSAVRNARLCLVSAVRTIIANGLRLIGVSAPQSM